jgi:L-asparaginase II
MINTIEGFFMNYQPAIEVVRGGTVESIHHAAIAVVDPEGKLVASWGLPETSTYMRSSAKPFQVLPLLEAGGASRFDFSLQEIALMCASHTGTDAHVRIALSIQEKVGVSEGDLLCGVHPPYDPETADRLKQEGIEPTANRHNCSGKHSGMLAFARLIGAPLEDYILPEHPIQKRILKVLGEMCDLGGEEIRIGVDGCSVPTFAVPLESAATAFARLADPGSLSQSRADACRAVWQAMTTYPEMVAGPGRFDTALMSAAKGSVLCKGGAEGYQGIAIAPGVLGKGSPALGVALKIADGDRGGRAGSVVALEVLQDLGLLSDSERDTFSNFDVRDVFNWRGIKVGQIRTCFELKVPI